jgi:predicted ATPase
VLNKVSIAGFKAIYDSKAVSLRPLTLMIGRNGSGKSSLIEALQWVQEALYDGLEQSTTRRFGSFEDLVNRRTDTIELDLLLDEGRNEIRYRLDVKARAGSDPRPIVLQETCREQRRKAAVWTIQTRRGRVGAAVRSLTKLRMNPVRDGNVLALASVHTPEGRSGAERLAAFLRTAVFLRLSPTVLAKPDALTREGPTIADDGHGTVALLQSLEESQREEVLKNLRRVLPGAERIHVRKLDKQLGVVELEEKMKSMGGKATYSIPAQLLSEGTRRLVTLYCLLAMRPRPSLIAVEEIENGLDPWTLRELFRELRTASDDGVQVVLTTHSPFLLDNVKPEEVIRVSRHDGETRFSPVIQLATVAKYDGVVAPGAMYLSGFLE